MVDYREMQAVCAIAKGIEELVDADIEKMIRIIGDPRIDGGLKFWYFRPRRKPKTQGAPYPCLTVAYIHGSNKVNIRLVRMMYYVGGWDREDRMELATVATTPRGFTSAMVMALKKARKMLQESQVIDEKSEDREREFFRLWGRRA